VRAAANPSREEFLQLAKHWTIIPVWKDVLADLTTPVAAFARLVGDEPGLLLE
jgi:anthranilate synthase component 1